MGEWLPDSKPAWWSTIKKIAKNPVKYFRGVIVGFVLTATVAVVKPIFSVIELIFLGSDPGTFGSLTETFGLADLPVLLARLGGNLVAWVLSTLFNIIVTLIRVAIPQVPSPIDGILASVIVVMIAVATVRIGFPLLQSALEAVPVVGGPLSTLLGKL